MAEYSICLLCLLRAICEDMPKCGPDDDIAFTLSIFCAGFSCKPRPHFFLLAACSDLCSLVMVRSMVLVWTHHFEQLWNLRVLRLWTLNRNTVNATLSRIFFIGHGSVHGLCVDASFRTTESSQALNFESNRNKVNVILTWLEISILALHAVPMRLEVIFSDEYQLQGIEISDGRQQGGGTPKWNAVLRTGHYCKQQTVDSVNIDMLPCCDVIPHWTHVWEIIEVFGISNHFWVTYLGDFIFDFRLN